MPFRDCIETGQRLARALLPLRTEHPGSEVCRAGVPVAVEVARALSDGSEGVAMTTDVATRMGLRFDIVSGEAEVLAHLWSRPTDREVSCWRRLAREHPETVESVLGSSAPLIETGAATLRAEYDRRIGGPHAWPASPFESMWRDDVPPRQRWGQWPPAVAALRSIYAALRFEPPPSSRVDEITVELNALATAAADHATEALARSLVTEHLSRWLPEFLRAVAQTTGEPFYRKLADATARWLNRAYCLLRSA